MKTALSLKEGHQYNLCRLMF